MSITLGAAAVAAAIAAIGSLIGKGIDAGTSAAHDDREKQKAELLAQLNHQYDLDLEKYKAGNARDLATLNNDASLARQVDQQKFEKMMDDTKYQRAVDDMKSAGLNINALGSGGMSSPTVADGGAGSVRPVGDVSMSNQDDISTALMNLARKNPKQFKKLLKRSQANNAKQVMTALKSLK